MFNAIDSIDFFLVNVFDFILAIALFAIAILRRYQVKVLSAIALLAIGKFSQATQQVS